MVGTLLKLLVKDKLLHSRKVPVNAERPLRREKRRTEVQQWATGKAGNGKRDGNGNGKWQRETGTGICTKREETTAPRSLFTNSSRDDSATALTAILFTN